MIHILAQKVNNLLVYPQITFGGVVRKYIKCDDLSQINVLDLSLKSNSGHLQQLKIHLKFFSSLKTSIMSSLFIRI